MDLSLGTELLPPYKVKNPLQEAPGECELLSSLTPLLLPPQVLILTLSDLSAVSHLVVSASNLNGKQVIKNRTTHFLRPASFWGR